VATETSHRALKTKTKRTGAGPASGVASENHYSLNGRHGCEGIISDDGSGGVSVVAVVVGAGRGRRAELYLRVREAVRAGGHPEHEGLHGQMPGERLRQELRGGVHAQGLPQAAPRGHLALRARAAHPRRGAHAAPLI
jgi:hypothetical protein